jgi:hypothetical protein
MNACLNMIKTKRRILRYFWGRPCFRCKIICNNLKVAGSGIIIYLLYLLKDIIHK